MDKDGIELCNNPNDVFDQNTRINSFFDLFKGDGGVAGGNDGFGVGGGASGNDAFGDIFGGGGSGAGDIFGGSGSGANSGGDTTEEKKKQQKRDSTIIDVDVTKDD